MVHTTVWSVREFGEGGVVPILLVVLPLATLVHGMREFGEGGSRDVLGAVLFR
jgi:hypothetical protein